MPSVGRIPAAAAALALLAGARVAAQDSPPVARILLAPASVEAGSGTASSAIDAARESFTSFLTGPSLRAEALKSRLASQVKEEAKQAGCPYLLLTTIKHVQKRSGGGLLKRTRPAPLGLFLSLAAVGVAEAQAPAGRIPMGTGATIVQTLSTPTADRESVHRVRLASDSGLHYEWLLEEVHDTGDSLRQEFRYLEAWADLADVGVFPAEPGGVAWREWVPDQPIGSPSPPLGSPPPGASPLGTSAGNAPPPTGGSPMASSFGPAPVPGTAASPLSDARMSAGLAGLTGSD